MKVLKMIVLAIVTGLTFSACAGMDPYMQRNYATNAVIGGAIGAAAGAGIAAATGGNVGNGALTGGLAGSFLWAANTPNPNQPSYAYSQPIPPQCPYGAFWDPRSGQYFCNTPPPPPPRYYDYRYQYRRPYYGPRY